jgi:hypothetical protein
MLLRQLQYLVTLAKTGHFTRAAEACHVSQPALSSAIQHLEKELEVSIVRRGQRFEGFTGLFSVVPHTMLCLFEMHQEVTAIRLNPKLSRSIGLIALDRELLSPLLSAACHLP